MRIEPYIRDNADIRTSPREADELQVSAPSRAAVLGGRPRDIIVDDKGFVIGRTLNEHRRLGSKGLVFLGWFSEPAPGGRALDRTPVYLDMANPGYLQISGKRGSGKSNTGVVLAGGARVHSGGVFIIDLNGCFRHVSQPNTDTESLSALGHLGWPPEGMLDVSQISLGKPTGRVADLRMRLPAAELGADGWRLLLDLPDGPLFELMLRMLRRVQEGYLRLDGWQTPSKQRFDIRDLVVCLESEAGINDASRGFSGSTRGSLSRRLESLDEIGLVGAVGIDIPAFCRPDALTVLDLSAPTVSISTKECVVAWFARTLLQMGISGISDRSGRRTTWMFVEEAPSFFTGTRTGGAAEAISSYILQGRQFGLGAALISQQASAIPKSILSQVDVFIQHGSGHLDDLDAFRRNAPAVVPRDFLRDDGEIARGLARGAAIVADRHTQHRPFLIQVPPSRCHCAGMIAGVTSDPSIIKVPVSPDAGNASVDTAREPEGTPSKPGPLVPNHEAEKDARVSDSSVGALESPTTAPPIAHAPLVLCNDTGRVHRRPRSRLSRYAGLFAGGMIVAFVGTQVADLVSLWNPGNAQTAASAENTSLDPKEARTTEADPAPPKPAPDGAPSSEYGVTPKDKPAEPWPDVHSGVTDQGEASPGQDVASPLEKTRRAMAVLEGR